jgi:O-antigen/teichoic acid export membrane protein
MVDLRESARVAGRGGGIIFFSNILSTLVSAVGTIIVIRFLSSADFGLYTVSTIPAFTILLFGDWGVNTALTKFIAQYRAEGKKEGQIASIVKSSLIFKVGLSLALSSLLFCLSDFWAGFVLEKPEVAVLVQVSSLMFLGSQLYSTCWSIFRNGATPPAKSTAA